MKATAVQDVLSSLFEVVPVPETRVSFAVLNVLRQLDIIVEFPGGSFSARLDPSSLEVTALPASELIVRA